MKLIHFSDTHLRYNDLDSLKDENINQREVDFYDAFSQIVGQIKPIKPDYIIHTGDLFHRLSPSNRAITFALEQFKIINKLNIPFILITGNYSTPRTNLSYPIVKIFEGFKNIYVSYNQEYKKVEFKDVIFHTLPHMNDDSKVLERINTDKNSFSFKANYKWSIGSKDVKHTNYVTIKHSDGTKEERGQLLGNSGKTGHAQGPHLHFVVYKATDGKGRESIPIKFMSI